MKFFNIRHIFSSKKSFLGEKSLLFSKKFGAFGVKTCGFIKKIGAPLLVGSPFSISDHDRIFGHTFSEKFMENFQSWVKVGKSFVFDQC